MEPKKIGNFAHLCGCEVEQVCVGKFDLSYVLNPTGRISIWFRGELLSAERKSVSVWQESRRSENFGAFVDLLGAVISEVSFSGDSMLQLTFKDGRQLLLFEGASMVESYSVNNIIV